MTIQSKLDRILGRGYCVSTMVYPNRVSWFLHWNRNGVAASGHTKTMDDALNEILDSLDKLPLNGGL